MEAYAGKDQGIYDNRPIGVFDSGIGGLTVLREIWAALPNESTVYFGDCGRTPYGTKSHDTIVTYSLQNMRFLLHQNVKMIVIACGTASAHAVDAVRREAKVPVVEVITPGVQEAARITRNGRIGVIATRAAVSSGIYQKVISETASDYISRGENEAALKQLYIEATACPLFVSLAEEGWWDNQIAQLTAEAYLASLKSNNIDTLVLGCTHYPLLSKTIAGVMGDQVRLVNSGVSVASMIKPLLQSLNMKAEEGGEQTRLFYTSDDPERFDQVTAPFLGGDQVIGARHARVEDYV
jgi:glutamate racemase